VWQLVERQSPVPVSPGLHSDRGLIRCRGFLPWQIGWQVTMGCVPRLRVGRVRDLSLVFGTERPGS
jgi:hypothetical protein